MKWGKVTLTAKSFTTRFDRREEEEEGEEEEEEEDEEGEEDEEEEEDEEDEEGEEEEEDEDTAVEVVRIGVEMRCPWNGGRVEYEEEDGEGEETEENGNDDDDEEDDDTQEDDDDGALRSGTNKNRDVSTGPLARPFARTAHSFACSGLLASPAPSNALYH